LKISSGVPKIKS